MLMAVMLVSRKHTFVVLQTDSHSLMRSSRKYPYLPTPLEISIKFHMYISLNVLVLQNPHPSGNSNPFCRDGEGVGWGSMDIFLGQHNVTKLVYQINIPLIDLFIMNYITLSNSLIIHQIKTKSNIDFNDFTFPFTS